MQSTFTNNRFQVLKEYPHASSDRIIVCALSSVGGFHAALAQDIPPPPTKDWKSIHYSPYPGEDFPNQVFYGDTHLHTSYSTDAGMVGCTLGPEEAYRFALERR